MDNPITQYIQHLIIDTVTAVTHLGTTIHIALWHEIITNQKSDTTNLLHKRILNIITQIFRKQIIIIIRTKADKGRTVVVVDKDVYQ